MFSAQDHAFMAQALRLAERGLWTTTPNPRVGCVLTREDSVVGEGWHEKAGEPHAEVHALRQAGAMARGATAYVTLEPCSHHGRTPPCADALVEAGVARVVVAMADPNPAVAGRGLERLRTAGIQVSSGLMRDEAAALNPGFIARMTRGRPWLRLKAAASLDGKTALRNGVSQWITGAAARQDVHRLRARSCALLTGIGTALHDDPSLTAREVSAVRQPCKVLVDSQLRLPPSAKLLAGAPLLIATASADKVRWQALEQAGAEILHLPGPEGRVDLAALLAELGRREMNEVMVEAGQALNGALLQAGLVDELLLYFAPLLLGDAARGLFNLPEWTAMEQRMALDVQDIRMLGPDLRITAKIKGS